MALQPLKARSISSARKRRRNLALASGGSSGPIGARKASELSAASIAEDKGIDLPSLKDLAKGAMPVVEAVTDTLAAPQRNAVSIIQGDGFVDPYGKEAETKDPSDALKLDGLAGFAVDVIADPLNVVPGAGIAKTALKSGAKGINVGLSAAKGSIDDVSEVSMRSYKKETAARIKKERQALAADNAKANEILAVDRRAGTEARATDNIRELRGKRAAAKTEQAQIFKRLTQISSGRKKTSPNELLYGSRSSQLRPASGFNTLDEEIAALRKQSKELDSKQFSLKREISGIKTARMRANRNPDKFQGDLISARSTKSKVAEKTKELDRQEEYLKTGTAQESFGKQDFVGQMADQALAAEARGVQLYLRPQFTNKRIALATVRSEKLAKAAEKVSKVPGLGKAANAVGKSFNTRKGTEQGVYESFRGVLGMGAQQAQRDVAPIARRYDKMSKAERADTTDIAKALYDKRDLDGASPDSWRFSQDTFQKEADTARQRAATATSDTERETFLRKADEAQDIADRAKTAADKWDNIGENARKYYLGIRKYYDDQAKIKMAAGEIKGTRANYVPSFDVAKDGRDMMPYAKESENLKLAESAQERKLSEGLPDEFDLFDSFRAAASETNRARYGRILARSLGKRFGKDYNPGEGWVEFAQGRVATGERLWIPKEIDDSITNMVKLGTSGRSQNELIRGFQKGVSKWKVLAYSINPGHFLVDTVGDLWNTSLRLGAAVVNPDRIQRVIPVQRDVEKYFVALEKGERSVAQKLAAKQVELGGHNYTIRELANGIEFASIRDTGYSVADIGDYNPRFGALARKGRLMRATASGMQVLGNKRDNLGKRLAYLLAVDVRGKSTKTPGNALLEAGRDVRISLFDYSELTPFEKSVARNAVPFYTWTRKNVPFQLRSIAERPALAMAPFKLQDNLAKQETNEDYQVPDYMRERYLRIGKLPGPIADILGQKEDEPFYLNPVIPTFDLGFLQNNKGVDLAQGLGMLNPAIKAPFEAILGKTVGTGAPIEGTLLSGPDDKGLPFLGRKGEYLAKSFLGQPGSVTVNTADDTRLEANRILPGVGMVTGIRGSTIDPAKQQERAEAQLREERRLILQYLQDQGVVPTSQELEELKKKRKGPELASLSQRRARLKPFGQ